MKNLNLPLIEQLPRQLVSPERFGSLALQMELFTPVELADLEQ